MFWLSDGHFALLPTLAAAGVPAEPVAESVHQCGTLLQNLFAAPEGSAASFAANVPESVASIIKQCSTPSAHFTLRWLLARCEGELLRASTSGGQGDSP